jgi:hypothetical protein
MKRVTLTAVVSLLLALALPSAWADEITDWNETLFRVALLGNTSPLVITRSAAIVESAVFDAVNGVEPRYRFLRVPPAAPAGASPRAAAVEAAFQTLTALYVTPAPTTPPAPAITTLLAARRAVSMLEIASDPHETAASIADGVAWGAQVADQILKWRNGPPTPDGFLLNPPVDPGGPPGKWQYTAPPIGPQFAIMATWILESQDQFRPGGPPALGSAQYAADFNETKSMGDASSLLRTRDQTAAVWFWGTSTASYLWNAEALSLIAESRDDDDHGSDHHGRHQGKSLVRNARLLALLNLAIADAAIACWDAKYHFLFWRPFQAIPRALEDGNAATDPSTTFKTVIPTPNHPEYPSGHSTVSGAAAGVLSRFFGDRTRLSFGSDVVLGTSRDFRSFTAALEEIKNARIFAGIHFRTACNDGQALGQKVAGYVVGHALEPLDDDD